MPIPKLTQRRSRALWLGWVLVFGVLEGWALLDRDPDATLSYNVYGWLAGHPHRIAAMFVFFAWVAWHFYRGARKRANNK